MQSPSALVILISGLLLSSCVSQEAPASGAATTMGQRINLTQDAKQKIGRKIWLNESSGTVEGLTSWNKNEYFASLGIGHFIWYTAKKPGPFDESWPKLIAFMKQRNVAMPEWIATTKDCPWNSYEEFHAAKNSAMMNELRGFLKHTIDVQTDFIVHRLQSALPKMKAQAANTAAERSKLERNFYAVASSPQGVYALIDYVNFKGEGIKPEERYKGQGWGLAQVLLEMEGQPNGVAASVEFGNSAKRVLTRRVENAKPKDESMWLRGWSNRSETYKKPL
ncbi:MAG: hypothetical protein AAGH89_05295 [Verrucomicrobiota bacterium]